MKVRDLKPGMLLNLEGDPYADPDHDNVYLEYEFQVVVTVEEETPECVVVYCENFTCAFPPDHDVEVSTTSEENAK